MKLCASFFTTLIIICNLCVAQNAEEQKVQQVIHRVFEGFSQVSVSMIEENSTADLKILEHGEVWTLDSVRFYFSKPRPADYKRINSLDFFQTEIKGDMAFVSYHNQADMSSKGRQRTVRWLESAVLVKEGEKWKLKMLHSTRK